MVKFVHGSIEWKRSPVSVNAAKLGIVAPTRKEPWLEQASGKGS
jgi:hypothetical protein